MFLLGHSGRQEKEPYTAVGPNTRFFIRNISDFDRAPCFLRFVGQNVSQEFLISAKFDRKSFKIVEKRCINA